jgi:hypothetical protein
MPVNIRHLDRIATVTLNESGNFEWSGDAAADATAITHDRLWNQTHIRGGSLSAELDVARGVASVLGNCEVIDADSIVKSLREGWVQVLRDNLMPDPNPDEKPNLHVWTGLECQIEVRGPKLRRWTVDGVVRVGDPKLLRCPCRTRTSEGGIRYPCVLSERVVCIHFSHRSPTPEVVIESRTRARKRLAERRQAKERP